MPSCIHWDGYYQKEGRKGKEWKVHVFGENMEKLEPVALLVRMWNVQLNSMETLQKVKNRIMIWLSNFTSGNIPKRTESRAAKRYLYNHVYNSITHNNWNVEAIPMSISRWIEKQNMEFFKEKILTHATVWTSPEDIMLSKISHSQNHKWARQNPT